MTKRKLHIIFLDFDDIKNPILGAGQARATLEVGTRLVKMGHKVTVICGKFPGYKDRTENGLQYRHIGVKTSNVRFNNMAYILLLPFTVRILKADLIVECFTAPVSTLFSQLFTKIPVVALTTSFEAERFSKLYHFPFEKIETFGLRFYKYFMPFTPHLERKIRKVNKKAQIRVIPEGVGNEFFAVKKKQPKHILFLGRFDQGQKGIDLLINAYAKMHTKTKYPLVLAGMGPDENKIRNLVAKNKLTDRVIFTGPAFGEKKLQLLSEALFVAFSSRHEGFSLFSLEALASGLPMASFDIPSLSWTDSRTVLKAKSFNVSEYAKVMLQLTDEKRVLEMSREARKVAKKYTWENVAQKFENFFFEIVYKYEN